MPLELDRPALVIVDVQQAIDDPGWGPRNNPNAEQVIAGLLAAWRRRGLPVIHVRHDSTEEASPYRPDLPTNAFKEAVAPLPEEAVVPKRTNNAFIGTDLAERLDSLGGEAVYVGALTNNSLEATVRMSGNLGYPSFVASDACWSVDKIDLAGRTWAAADVHALALANMHGEYATVVESTELLVWAEL